MTQEQPRNSAHLATAAVATGTLQCQNLAGIKRGEPCLRSILGGELTPTSESGSRKAVFSGALPRCSLGVGLGDAISSALRFPSHVLLALATRYFLSLPRPALFSDSRSASVPTTLDIATPCRNQWPCLCQRTAREARQSLSRLAGLTGRVQWDVPLLASGPSHLWIPAPPSFRRRPSHVRVKPVIF